MRIGTESPDEGFERYALILRSSDLGVDRARIWRARGLRALIWLWAAVGLSFCGGAVVLDALGPPEVTIHVPGPDPARAPPVMAEIGGEVLRAPITRWLPPTAQAVWPETNASDSPADPAPLVRSPEPDPPPAPSAVAEAETSGDYATPPSHSALPPEVTIVSPPIMTVPKPAVPAPPPSPILNASPSGTESAAPSPVQIEAPEFAFTSSPPVLASNVPAIAHEPLAPSSSPALLGPVLRRGEEMLKLGDISAARLLFGWAAAASSAPGAVALARTYDPEFLAASGVRGLKAEPGLARHWYRRAAELGDAAARQWLEAHPAPPPHVNVLPVTPSANPTNDP